MKLYVYKEFAYIWQTVLGVIFLALAYFLGREDGSGDFTRLLASWILTLPGLICLLFGITSFVLRREPDIWA